MSETESKSKKISGKKKISIKPKKIFLCVLAVCLLVAVVAVVCWRTGLIGKHNQEPEVISTQTLEKIIHVSELSTFTAVYNGIAQVNNEEKPDQVDYYVSYEAKVKAGIDLEKVDIRIESGEEGEKTIHVTLPDVHITNVTVEVSSLDYIFMNDKANTSTVSATAFKACEADVKEESSSEAAIFDLASQNAQNVLKALVEPFISQLDDTYKLVID